jgi:hypothetical protein
MNYNKFLLILILLLSVIIVGEFYYLFFFRAAEPKSISNQPAKAVEEKDQDISSPPPPPLPTNDPDQAFKEGLFDSLRTLRKGMVQSSTLTYVLKGTIEKIEYLSEGEKRAIAVRILADNGESSGFRFPGTDLVSVKDSGNRKIDLFTIKQNDKVTVTVQFDMIKIDYQSIVIQLQ